MSGVQGAGGPVPKRSSQRRRRNKDGEPEKAAAGARSAAVMPDPDPDWHAVARRWFDALGESGQSVFYEASDWALAWVIAENMSRELTPVVVHVDEETGEQTTACYPIKGTSMAAYLKAMAALLVTEGDRRRARLELERSQSGGDAEAEDGVVSIDEWRRRALGS
jgi:hypothetical protein